MVTTMNDSAIESKSQTLTLTTESKKTLVAVIRIVEYHAIEISKIKMNRRTAQAINGDFIPARPPSTPNPFANAVIVTDREVTIDDSMSNQHIEIIYTRSSATADIEIKRKIKHLAG